MLHTLFSWLPVALRKRLITKRCDGCADKSYHTAHLTPIGDWYFLRGN